jgi:hypothetical protein
MKTFLILAGSLLLAIPAAAAPTGCDGMTPIKPVDVRKVVAVLRTGDFRKGEFETTEQFNQRVSGTVNKAQQLFIASSGIDELVLTIPISAENIRYDADRGRMTAEILHNYNLDLSGVQISTSSRKAETDLVDRAYGHGNYGKRDGGAATEWDLSLASRRGFLHSRFDLTVTPDEARQVKNALALLVVGKLRSPYFQHDHHVLSYGDVRVTELIHADISCAALYDPPHGRILLQRDAARL